MISKKKECECPETATRSFIADWFGYLPEEEIAREHEPYKCKGTYGLKEYLRNGKKIWLCSSCNLLGDLPIGG